MKREGEKNKRTGQYFVGLQQPRTMLRNLILSYVFFLFCVSAPAMAHEGHSHSEADEDVASRIHEEFLHYLKSSEFGVSHASQAYIEINGRRYELNSSFYELLRLTLKASSPETCGSCVVEEVKQQSAKQDFLRKVSQGVQELFTRQTLARGGAFLDEYGYAAGVGYVLMEVLEHTAVGPLGICPILNLYYLYALDVIKQGQYVFASTYRTSIAKAIYFSFRSAFETFRLNKALKRPVFVVRDNEHEQPFAFSDFKKLRKEQGRYNWFMWQNWLDNKLSRRTLWPSAYINLDLDQSDSHEGHAHASPFKLLQAQPFDGRTSGLSFLKCVTTACTQEDSQAMDWWQSLPEAEQDLYREVYALFQSNTESEEELTSFSFRMRDIGLITDAKQATESRYLVASALQDILIFEFQALESLYQKELKKMSRDLSLWQYVGSLRRFHQLKIKIKKFGSALKAMALEQEQVPVYKHRQALLELGSILSIFEKASSLQSRGGPLSDILSSIRRMNACQELLTR